MQAILGIILWVILVIAVIVVGLFCIHCAVEKEPHGIDGRSDKELLDHVRKSVTCL